MEVFSIGMAVASASASGTAQAKPASAEPTAIERIIAQEKGQRGDLRVFGPGRPAPAP